jgi:hypothetical protein
MSLSLAAILTIAGAAAATGLTGAHYGANRAKAGTGHYTKQQLLDFLQNSGADSKTIEAVSNLSDSEARALQNDYLVEDRSFKNLWGLGDIQNLDTERLLGDLSFLTENEPQRPEAPLMEDFISEDALNNIMGSRLGELNSMRADRQARYDQELADIDSEYAGLRNNLISTQARQDAQLMDTMRSEMSRSRRNALEAGASAGIRLADNINIMLSNQNKQAQTSLETSNQLAQMAINQRAAKRNAQDSYDAYMNQNYRDRTDLRNQAYSEANTRYNAAMQSYDTKLAQYNDENASNLGAAAMYNKGRKRANSAGNSGMYNSN